MPAAHKLFSLLPTPGLGHFTSEIKQACSVSTKLSQSNVSKMFKNLSKGSSDFVLSQPRLLGKMAHTSKKSLEESKIRIFLFFPPNLSIYIL